ncbi:PD-(D/E)XK nuclease family protein [Flavobacterium sp. SM15]|uniref:PD-(D/E)XK nuclease family protein n=1 Tax=Flavobacterium sp. SM15 TaxID=2908005 RepID=UPI001EDB94F0|nr:PD-(D/E)XK nuclease family protein [Flavobacterium sp. SM15]MCG2610229.1 PD-(D/E)XK nuclease family protein [Flavobacterium sp. SM15]
MTNPTFLDTLSAELVRQFGESLDAVQIILPNKRAKVFLIEALKRQLPETVFAPEIISIEDFVQDVSGIRNADPIELLFEFYNVYLSITPLEKQQDFELFANWGKTLLQDFNEIDRYLLPPNHVFSYLKDIEVLKRWDLEASQTTRLIDNHLEFWSKLPEYYASFYQHLLIKGIGYQGLIYREAVENLNHFSETLGVKKLIFAGFNALNQAEEKIIQQLLFNDQAKIYWDIDETFLNDSFHDAGLFIRRFRKEWKQYTSTPFEWLVKEFSQAKNIRIIGTPKTIGQAKIAGKIIEGIQAEGASLDKTALVLGEENLLIPALYALPDSVTSLNITMGYGSKNNPAQILVGKLFKLHANALQRNAKSYTFYYKEVLEVLTHPLIEPYVKAKEVVQIINKNNITFLSQQHFVGMNPEPTALFKLLFERWEDDALLVTKRLSELLLVIKSNLSNDTEDDKIAKAFLHSVFKVLNKLITYCETYSKIDSIATLHTIYKQIIDLAEVSFEGEPLSGLQIMGVLESRVLDFENVIITSMNEGVFPAGKSTNSFIPYDVKRELGLPTYKEKDAIYCYHFYHLLLRAKNIYLLYNTESEGLDAGEKSRFITQLEIERQPKHTITNQIFNAYLPDKAYEPVQIPKSKKVMERLKEIATDKGFSPSGLTSYIRNPIQFYNQRVLRISEVEEVEENIALNTLGTIIHGVLEELYKPLLNRFLTVELLDEMFSKANEEVERQFREVYKEGEIKKGKNLLAFEVAKRNVFNFLSEEKKNIQAGDAVKVLALETSLDCLLEDQRLPYPVKIAGNVDRIEQRNGKIRIIDYKTGKVELRNVQLKSWNGLTSEIKNDKIIQLLCYALMYEEQLNGLELEAGIISFKNMKAGFMPFGFKEDRSADTLIGTEVLADFKTEIIHLINEILNPEVSFEEKLN